MTANQPPRTEPANRVGAPLDPPPAAAGIFGRRFRWITIGMCALIMLSAFEALAVTTVMPAISADLHGAALYAFAFAGPLAVSVVGMVAAGAWSDRRNPRDALFVSVALFVIGLIVAGTAADMGAFVIGRLVHGLGGGALTVALYVIVARLYPPTLHPRIFAGFAAAWVIPSLIGPSLAGIVADQVGWRWVFLGVVALVPAAMVMVVPATRAVSSPDGTRVAAGTQVSARRIGWSILTAIAVLALTLSADLTGVARWVVAIVATAVAVFALRPLLPPLTLRGARGLPSVIVMRGLASAAFFGTEVYVPYLLTSRYGLPPWLSGLALTAAGVSWSAASWVQGRYPSISHRLAIRVGVWFLTTAVIASFATALLDLHPVVQIVGWGFAGAGMGLLYPRLTIMALESSTPTTQGFNSSALTIADSIGSAIALAATGIVFAAPASPGGRWPFAGCFALTAAICSIALAITDRLVPETTV